MARELTRSGLRFEVDVAMDLVYEELIVPRAYRIDFIVEECVGLALGLLLNFGAATMTEGIERVVNNFPHGTPPMGRRSSMVHHDSGIL